MRTEYLMKASCLDSYVVSESEEKNMEKHILKLDDIIMNLYLICGKKYKKRQEDLFFLLNKESAIARPGELFPDSIDKNVLSSIRTGGIKSKSRSGFPKTYYQVVIDRIVENPKIWFQQHISHLQKNSTSDLKIRMGPRLIDYIWNTICDKSIDMNDEFRLYLMNPKIAEELEGKNAIHWMRLSWLILFSVLQNTMIEDLEEVWTLPDKYRFARRFDEINYYSTFSSTSFTGQIIKTQVIQDEGGSVIDVQLDFSPHQDIQQVPEWASIVCWLPGMPIDYEEFEGILKFDIHVIYGLSSIKLELQNVANEGGHMYYPSIDVDDHWKSIEKGFSSKEVPTHILKSFGAICFVFNPDEFSGQDRKAHIQIRNIEIVQKF